MLKDLGERVEELTKKKAFQQALDACDDALRELPESEHPEVWYHRALVHKRMKKLDEAFSDLSQGLVLAQRDKPLHFSRARVLVEMHRFQDALIDIGILLEEDKKGEAHAYEEAAKLLQVLCFGMLDRLEEALRLCSELPPNATFWALGKVWTPAELEAETRAKLKR